MATPTKQRSQNVSVKPASGGRTQQGAARRSRGTTAPAPARTGGRTSQGTSGTRRVPTATTSNSSTVTTNQQRYDAASARVSQVAPDTKLLRQNYQPIILMEFLGCIILTAATPVAKKTTSDGLSPYAGADMVKLVAITVLYFILAAMSTGGRSAGRTAAWFGGLILITDGMLEAASLAKVFGLFTGGTAAAAAGSSAAAPSSTQSTAQNALAATTPQTIAAGQQANAAAVTAGANTTQVGSIVQGLQSVVSSVSNFFGF
jgi:hypothetical protein